MNNIIGLLRVKNEERYLPTLLKQLESICDNILVINDGSTDKSLEILKSFKKVHVKSQYGKPFHGGRDWIQLHKWAAKFNPSWVVALDADVEIGDDDATYMLKLIENSDEFVDAWSFPYFYMWGSSSTYRWDKHYKDKELVAVFRYKKGQLPRNVLSHSTPIPEEILKKGLIRRCDDIRIKHFGYMLKKDRIAKYEFYTKRDKDPMSAGAGVSNYSHMLSKPNKLLKWGDFKNEKFKICITEDKWYPGGYLHIMTKDIKYNKFKKDSIDELLVSSSILSKRGILDKIRKCLKHWAIVEIEYNIIFDCYGSLKYSFTPIKKMLEGLGFVCIEKRQRERCVRVTCRTKKD